MVRGILVAALLVGWSGVGTAQIAAQFYLEKTNYATGEPIFLYFRTTNEGSKPEKLYSADPNSDCSAFHITVPDERTVLSARPAQGCTRFISCGSSSIVLQPNEKHIERILLNLAHDVSYPGDYSVKADIPEGFAYGSTVNLKPATLHFQVDPRAVQTDVLQPLIDQLRSDDVLKRIEAGRALASVAPPFLESTLLRFAADPYLLPFAALAFHRLNTPTSMKALADLLKDTAPGSFEHWEANAYLTNDECADAPWRNFDVVHRAPLPLR